VGEPVGSHEVAKRRTETIRTVGPTLIKGDQSMFKQGNAGPAVMALISLVT